MRAFVWRKKRRSTTTVAHVASQEQTLEPRSVTSRTAGALPFGARVVSLTTRTLNRVPPWGTSDPMLRRITLVLSPEFYYSNGHISSFMETSGSCRKLDAGGSRGRPDRVFRRARCVRTTHPKAALSRLAPHRRALAYREEEGGPLLSRPYPFGFLFDPSLRETRGGFEPTINLAWFDGLHMPLETPGCESLEAACDDGACRGR